NRLAEACFRQVVSWVYQLRGFVVVYDRHFLFDAATSGKNKVRKPTDRLYYWLLAHVFPQPELVLFLDAPPELLFARKGEGSVEYLQRKREVYLAQGGKMDNFVRVDAAQPPEEVLADVNRHITSFQAGKRMRPEVPSHEA
ncbi:MAG TPA: hypothetical protein VE553_01800, partial [Candidatus Binatia bacterium]|nr:hypothetical protein [Candidatus Binatia bacterium]